MNAKMLSHALNTAAAGIAMEVVRPEAVLRTGPVESAISNRANFSRTAADGTAVIQIFAAEPMLEAG
jgi:hypothetical protein